MIFNQQVADRIMYQTTGGLYNTSTALLKVVVYGGTQPSWTTFESDWTTDYWLDTTSETTSSEVLAVYGGAFSSSSTNAVTLEIVDENVLTTANLTQTSEHFNDGTATWALIVRYNQAFDKTAEDLSEIKALIVPVSDPAGQGVVKMFSTSITGGVVPNLSSFNLVYNIA